jgi:hypothetical protein
MTKETRVKLIGQAHKDAQELLLNTRAGVSAEYIARRDGTILTVNRERVGVLPKKLYQHPETSAHGYKSDVTPPQKSPKKSLK